MTMAWMLSARAILAHLAMAAASADLRCGHSHEPIKTTSMGLAFQWPGPGFSPIYSMALEGCAARPGPPVPGSGCVLSPVRPSVFVPGRHRLELVGVEDQLTVEDGVRR